MYFKLGLRNVFRNKRRSMMTIVSIALGFAAINLFGGYINDVFASLAESAIRGEQLGHITFVKKGFYQEGKLHPEKYRFNKDELAAIAAIAKADPNVELITPRLSLQGLISNGDNSTIFIAEGLVPADAIALRGDFWPERKGMLKPDKPEGVTIAEDLARILDLEVGGSVTLFTSTTDGIANALDAEVVEVYNTGNAGTNDKFAMLPLEFSQRLLDDEGAERLVVLLRDRELTESVRAQLGKQLADAGFELESRSWIELSAFYTQVKNMFGMIFLFIFIIVLIIVVMSIINTMSMVVVERTREIGTLRALGMKRMQVSKLFSAEGILLSLIGCLIGLVLTLLVATTVNAAGITYTPPNSTDKVALLIRLAASQVAFTFAALSGLGMIAALIPAAKAAKSAIVDALGHV